MAEYKSAHSRKAIRRTLAHAAVLFCAAFGIGLLFHHNLVAQGFTGALTLKIKNRLQQNVNQEIASPAADNQTAGIIPIHDRRAKRWWDNGTALFIDARPERMYKQGHIPGALNVNEANLEDHFFFIMDCAEESRLIIYCAGPACPEAAHLAHVLVEQEITPVYVFTGGWDVWTENGYPIQKTHAR